MFPFTVWAPIILPVVLGGHHRKFLPYDMNGPFKQIMMSLFRLAWSSKIRLPLLITVAFLALDVHLQMEINVFWEANHREIEGRENDERQRRRQNGTQPHRPLVPSSTAPLAEAEDLDDEDDEVDSSPHSTVTLNTSSTPVQSTRGFRFWENLRPLRRIDYDDDDDDDDEDVESEEEETSLVCSMTPAEESQSQC